MESLSHQKGFTLTEMLVVIFIIGILSGTGAGYYAKMANDIKTQTLSESLSAFMTACQKRASLRGMEVHPTLTSRGIGITESATLFCPLPKPTTATKHLLENLSFSATQTFLLGKPIQRLDLEFSSPQGPSTAISFELKP